MRSADVAQLCGVTVRTLRHYHRIGLLPEPPRLRNDYRSYDEAHVARLLRIRTLADAGVPLAQIGSLLDGIDTPAAVLRRAEQDLSARIRDLHERRDLVRALTESADDEGFTALPAPLARSLRAPDVEVPVSWRRFDENLALMLHSTTSDPERKRLIVEAYHRASVAAATPAFLEVLRRFRALAPDARADETDGVVRATVRALDALNEVEPMTLSRLQRRGVELLIRIGPFNPPQRAVLQRLLLESPRFA